MDDTNKIPNILPFHCYWIFGFFLRSTWQEKDVGGGKTTDVLYNSQSSIKVQLRCHFLIPPVSVFFLLGYVFLSWLMLPLGGTGVPILIYNCLFMHWSLSLDNELWEDSHCSLFYIIIYNIHYILLYIIIAFIIIGYLYITYYNTFCYLFFIIIKGG